MKTTSLYKNQTKMVESISLRTRLSILIEDAETPDLIALGNLMLNKDWDEKDIEMDLGSTAIEALLDEIENADHQKVDSIYKSLVEQGVRI
jgi:hypothetical protein